MPRIDPACERSESAEPLRAVAMTVSSLGILPASASSDDPAARQDFRQAPVHHLDLAERAHHHVRRLQVAMDHPPGVGIRDRLRDRLEDREEPGQAVGRILAAGQQLGQRVPLDQLHAEERPAIAEGAHLVDRHDPRVLQLAADLRLLDEPADHVGVIAEILAEHLQGHVAAEVRVASLEHRAHAASGDLAVDPVARAGARIVATARAMERRFGAAVGVAEQDARDRADARGKGVEDPSAGGANVDGLDWSRLGVDPEERHHGRDGLEAFPHLGGILLDDPRRGPRSSRPCSAPSIAPSVAAGLPRSSGVPRISSPAPPGRCATSHHDRLAASSRPSTPGAA